MHFFDQTERSQTSEENALFRSDREMSEENEFFDQTETKVDSREEPYQVYEKHDTRGNAFGTEGMESNSRLPGRWLGVATNVGGIKGRRDP